MEARHWMWIAALTAALSLTGPAIAYDTGATPRTDETVSDHPTDTPASGAIVTPEDKAYGLGKREHARSRDGDEGAANADALRAMPPPSNDDESSAIPGSSNEDGSSVNPPRSDPDDRTPAAARGR